MEQPVSYLNKRLQEMHLTDADTKTRLIYSVGEQVRESEVHFLTATDKDDIAITVYDLDRRVIEYDYRSDRQTDRVNDNAPLTRDYQVIRRSPKYLKEHPDAPKYMFPGGEEKKGTYPFLPPLLLDLYEQKREIDTLVLTEGYLKAIKACRCGIPCVGLGSVTLFADSRDGFLYKDIRRLITTLKPLNVVILYDADCLDLSHKFRSADVDLAERPMSFYGSLMRLFDLLQEFRDVNIYFSYPLRLDGPDSPKGLDDILIRNEESGVRDKESGMRNEKLQAIIDDLLFPTRQGIYFRKVNLRRDYKKVKPLFGLTSVRDFYELHKDEIQTQTFMFHGGVYKYLPQEKDLIRVLQGQIKDFYHIDNTFYERALIPDPVTGGKEYQMLPRKKETVELLFDKEAPKLIVKQQHFKKFENFPSHLNYEPYIGDCFNIYKQLTWEPAPGDFPTIEKLLKHIFPDETPEKVITSRGVALKPVSPYNIILDYFTLLYKEPKQWLPVICLVSKERATGKTTFLNLLKYMFGGNCVNGGVELVLSRFNTAIAGKLIIGIDETDLSENAAVTEKIKMLSTSERIMMEGKGKDMTELANFAKFVICSNNEKKFMLVDSDEVRLWVIKVKSIEGALDIDINRKIQTEIPAFAHYLLNRPMAVPKFEHRMWFDPARFESEELRKLKEASSSYAERTIRDFIEEVFAFTNTDTLCLDAAYFKENFEEFRFREMSFIRALLEDRLKGEKQGVMRVAMPVQDPLSGDINWGKNKQCRPYLFHRKDFE